MSESSPTIDAASNRCPACDGDVPLSSAAEIGDGPCPHCGQALWFLRRTAGPALVLTFLPGLITGSEGLGRLHEVITAVGECPCLVVDLAHLRVVTSLFLAMLVRLHVYLVEDGGAMRVCGLDPLVRESIEVTKLDELLVLTADEPQALASF